MVCALLVSRLDELARGDPTKASDAVPATTAVHSATPTHPRPTSLRLQTGTRGKRAGRKAKITSLRYSKLFRLWNQNCRKNAALAFVFAAHCRRFFAAALEAGTEARPREGAGAERAPRDVSASGAFALPGRIIAPANIGTSERVFNFQHELMHFCVRQKLILYE